MKKAQEIFIFVFILLVFLTPILALAAPIVPPCGDNPNTPEEECEWAFKELMILIHNVINFVLFKLALPLAAIMFAYAGFKLVTSGGSDEARGKAKSIFTNTAIGLIVAAGAWLIVKTFLSIAGYTDGGWIGF